MEITRKFAYTKIFYTGDGQCFINFLLKIVKFLYKNFLVKINFVFKKKKKI